MNLDRLDADLLADIAQQLKDGLITKQEAARLVAMIKGTTK